MSVTVHVKTQMMPLRLVRILTHCLARILVSLYRCSERCWQSCSKLLHFTKSTIYITISEACLQYNCKKIYQKYLMTGGGFGLRLCHSKASKVKVKLVFCPSNTCEILYHKCPIASLIASFNLPDQI